MNPRSFVRYPVKPSTELTRIVALPRRPQEDLTSERGAALAQLMTERLSNGQPCACSERCISSLKPAQAWALYEMGITQGLLGALGVGIGKTLLGILTPMVVHNCKLAVLLIPPTLKEQLVREYRAAAKHFRVPSLVLEDRGHIVKGAPILQVIPYSMFSRANSTDYLEKLQPDLIIADECFPGHVKVTTDEGDVPIEDVVQGKGSFALSKNLTTGQLEWRQIVRRMPKTSTKKLFRLHHERGVLECTEDHKIFVHGVGYVKANEVTVGVRFEFVAYKSQEERNLLHLQDVREGVLQTGARCSCGKVGEVLLGSLQVYKSRLEIEDEKSDAWSEATELLRKNEGEQSYVQAGEHRENETSKREVDVLISGRKRTTDEASTEDRRCDGSCDGVCNTYCTSERPLPKSTIELQSGPCMSRCSSCNRDRWRDTQDQEVEVLGQEKDRDIELSRVVRVEILEQGSRQSDGGCSVSHRVYDLEVEGNHNYFADGVLVSNCHRLKNKNAASTSRVLRYFAKHPDTRLCAWSGTITSKSIKDYWHLLAFALDQRSPLPLEHSIVEEWSLAIDPSDNPSPPGALSALCQGDETVQQGYYRRLTQTRGVVATKVGSVEASLQILEHPAPKIPDNLNALLKDLRKSWTRPDGEELTNALDVARVASELASGFYYRWRFPKGEPRDLIDEWFRVRQAWNKELREKLKNRTEHLDSPLLLENAAARYEEGYKGPLPKWKSEYYREWSDIKKQVYHESEAIWVSDFLARDAASWASKNKGLVWYEHNALGDKISQLAGLPKHGGGPDAESNILAEKGNRSVIASISAHGTGRDGLQRLFDTQLVCNPPGDALVWEQLLGRLHRQGQEADEVTTYVYRHTTETKEALDRAILRAQYIQATTGNQQKILSATLGW